MTQPGALRFALVGVALALGILAQLLIGNGSFKWAITPYIVAVAALALVGTGDWGLGTGGRGTTSPPVPVTERLLGLGSFALSLLLLAISLRWFAAGPPNTVAWYCYGASVIIVLLALPTLDGRWSGLARHLRERPQISIGLQSALVWAALGAILLLALLIRLYHLQELPAGLWYDEADNINQANLIQRNPGAAPVYVPSTNLPSMFLLPIAGLIELTGVSMSTARLASVAFGLAGIVAIFLLARLMLGPFLALVAAFLTAVMRWDINWSRIGMHGITTPLFAALTAYLLLRALRSGRISDYGFAGAALGLGLWFYASFRLFPLVMGVILLHHIIFQRPNWRPFLGQLAVMGLVALAVIVPVLEYAALEPERFFARTGRTSVFGLMPFDEAIVEAWKSLGKHALMFNYEGDPNPRHNLPYAPMLDFGSGVLFLLGLGLALTRWRNVALFSLPFWILLMALPGVLTIPWEAPQSLRAIGALPAVVIVVTLAFGAIWRAGRTAPWPLARRATPLVLAASLGGIAFLNVNTYFGAQARDPRVYSDFSTDQVLMARHMLDQQRRGYSFLVSRHFLFSLTTSLLANSPRVEVVRAPDWIPIDPSRVWLGASIYLEPREGGFYRLLQAYYPDGRFEEVRPPGGGDVLFYSAVISREQLEAPQGLIARHTLPGGATREVIKSTTESAWLLEAQPEELPLDFAWEGVLHVTRLGQYLFALEGEMDAQVLLDGRRILYSGQQSVRIEPAVGLHSLEVRGRVVDRATVLRLLWQPPGGQPGPIPLENLYHGSVRPVGLAGRFYKLSAETGAPDSLHVTPSMDTFWYDPVTSLPYLAVWEGTLDVPARGEYRFRVGGSGSVKLLLDGRLRAENPGAENIGPEARVTLSAGKRRIWVEQQSSASGSQHIEVLWAPPGRGFEPIPIERLSPEPEEMFIIRH